jgi:hypothetical protein|tara:strand:- start:522 stop:914 length:393 start_codon:yes stop_codon:yes gene_type:complete
MTQEEALSWVKAMTLKTGDTTNCAVDLCVYDIEMHGLDDWLTWDPMDISKIFSELTHDSVQRMIDEIEAQQAGEAIIEELLNVDQERLNMFEESKKVAKASAKMLDVLTKYYAIHGFIKTKINEENDSYR